MGCKFIPVTLKYCRSINKGDDIHELYCKLCRMFSFHWSQNTELCEMALIHFTIIHLYLFLGTDCISTRSACPLDARTAYQRELPVLLMQLAWTAYQRDQPVLLMQLAWTAYQRDQPVLLMQLAWIAYQRDQPELVMQTLCSE